MNPDTCMNHSARIMAQGSLRHKTAFYTPTHARLHRSTRRRGGQITAALLFFTRSANTQ